MSDLIDRKKAIDATWFEPTYTDPLNVLTEVRDRLEALPSAQPEIKCIAKIMLTDEQVQEAFEKAKKEILAAQPERKKGKWKRTVLGSTSGYGTTVMYQCSECEQVSISKHRYCPNCGCAMETEVEE